MDMTREAIKGLHRESLENGDKPGAALCWLALYGYITQVDMDEMRPEDRAHLETHYGVARTGGTNDGGAQERARLECLRVIEFFRY